MKNLRNLVRSEIIAGHAVLSGRKPESAIVLSCYARGGSTWLAEVLSQSIQSSILWEPFHLDEAPKVREFGFSWREHIPPDADWPEAEILVRQILSGRHINSWTGSASSIWEHLSAQEVIVKCCRANGFLPWLVRRITFNKKPIHFMRHPFAMVSSMLKFGGFDSGGLKDVLLNGRYVERLQEHDDYILGLQSDEERIVAMWCRNQIPCLKDPEASRYWTSVHYEHLLLKPQEEIKRIFSDWSLPVSCETLERISKPSRMTQNGALEKDALVQVSKWQQMIPDSKQRAMQAVLDHFGVKVYGTDPLPNSQGVSFSA